MRLNPQLSFADRLFSGLSFGNLVISLADRSMPKALHLLAGG